MQLTRRGKGFSKISPFYDVDLKRTDAYMTVVMKACETIGIDVEEKGEMSFKLLTSRGSIIVQDDNWTIGSYLSKRHISAEKLSLGIGSDVQCNTDIENFSSSLEDNSSWHCSVPKKAKIRENVLLLSDDENHGQAAQMSKIQKKPNEKFSGATTVTKPAVTVYRKEASTSDTLKVFYGSDNRGLVPMSRLEAWNSCNHREDWMDKYGIFAPEECGFRVIQIILVQNGKEIPILSPNYDGIVVPNIQCDDDKGSPVVFTSSKKPVLTSLSKPVPLIVVSRAHPYCAYSWECVEKPQMMFESSPVVYVKKPFIYKCSVRNGGRIVDTVNFDVSFDLPSDVVIDNRSPSSSPPPPTYEEISIPPPRVDSLEFTLDEIMASTSHLNKINEIGCGGYGSVFLAENLRTKGTHAAVKVLSKEGTEAIIRNTTTTSMESMLKGELQALMKFRHPNILEIMGYCYCKEVKALVYQYMESGSLYKCLHTVKDHLTWLQRISIMKDVFQGLAYLHQSNPPMIHQDIKSLNILLDQYKKAVIGDFGFALELPKSVSGRTMVTAPFIARTEGYFPPELMNGKISPLCDVYSCGVLVLETYSGLQAYCKDRTDPELAEYTVDMRSSADEFLKLADCSVPLECTETAETFRTVANSCLKRHSQRVTANEALLLWDHE